MYRILLVVSERDLETLYKYLTVTDEAGVKSIYEAETLAELDIKVEDMLNNGGYAKSDFVIISTVDYSVKADILGEYVDANEVSY